MSSDMLDYNLASTVARITLNAPDSGNAMTQAMAEAFMTALDKAEMEARAILISGAGKHFSTGANLNNLSVDLADPLRDMGANLEKIVNPILMRLRGSDLPVITAINGTVAGVGCGIALAGDFMVAAEDAQLFCAFSRVGLVPDGGLSYLLTKTIGRPRASEIMMLGGKISANQALEWGLINRVVPSGDLLDFALEIAQRLADGPKSIGQIKRLAWNALESPFETMLAEERSLQKEAGRSADFLEGIAAFRERRSPHFTGM